MKTKEKIIKLLGGFTQDEVSEKLKKCVKTKIEPRTDIAIIIAEHNLTWMELSKNAGQLEGYITNKLQTKLLAELAPFITTFERSGLQGGEIIYGYELKVLKPKNYGQKNPGK